MKNVTGVKNRASHCMNRQSQGSSQRQRGYTLIELMIASVLGLIVIGGMYTLFTINQQTVRMQTNLSAVQEEANFALDLIAEDLRMSGWPGVFDTAGTEPFGARDETYPLFQDQWNRYDTLVVSRRGRPAQPGNPDPLRAQHETDCVGNVIDFNVVSEPLTHIYFVNPDTRELMCRSTISDDEQAIIGNVEAFQVLYGVDMVQGPCPVPDPALTAKDAAAECMTPTRYVNGADLPAALQTALDTFGADATSHLFPMKTVRLAIMVSTEEGNLVDRQLSQNKWYFVLDQWVGHNSDNLQLDDGRIRRIAMRTVALRQAFRGP